MTLEWVVLASFLSGVGLGWACLLSQRERSMGSGIREPRGS